ncbi:MAG: hypothetical protein QOG61_1067 [Candidatus Binataceae bacterium]|nr:hypothetical protein [Candidatus Binataceae bacterium]
MDNIVEHSDEGEFANGQISRDLRVNSDRTEPQTQEAVNVIEQPEEFPAPENPEREPARHGSHFLTEQIDADERLPGHLREPHLPRLESRRARNFANSLGIADQSESLSPACT